MSFEFRTGVDVVAVVVVYAIQTWIDFFAYQKLEEHEIRTGLVSLGGCRWQARGKEDSRRRKRRRRSYDKYGKSCFSILLTLFTRTVSSTHIDNDTAQRRPCIDGRYRVFFCSFCGGGVRVNYSCIRVLVMNVEHRLSYAVRILCVAPMNTN